MQSSLPDGRPLLHITRLTRSFSRPQSSPLFGDNLGDNAKARKGDGGCRLCLKSGMDSKFDNLAERMDSRLDALMSVIVNTRTYPDAITARLEREVQELRKA